MSSVATQSGPARAALSSWMDEKRRWVDAQLEAYLQSAGPCPERLYGAMRYSLLSGGKRLRPMLVLMAAEACGGPVEKALAAACAVEMVHAYSLVHDDLPAMDDDDLRRGRPTTHKAFGEATAILAGDALLTLAFAVLSQYTEPAEVAAACCRELARAAGAAGMVGGQADDLEAERRSREALQGSAGLEQLESIHLRKTGALLAACLRLGALAAGAEARDREALDGYGGCFGLAFQITDDLLDVQGDESHVGKRVGKDGAHGKLTYPALLGVEASRRRARELIAEACRHVVPMGGRAARLVALAESVMERDR